MDSGPKALRRPNRENHGIGPHGLNKRKSDMPGFRPQALRSAKREKSLVDLDLAKTISLGVGATFGVGGHTAKHLKTLLDPCQGKARASSGQVQNKFRTSPGQAQIKPRQAQAKPISSPLTFFQGPLLGPNMNPTMVPKHGATTFSSIVDAGLVAS